VKGPSSTDKKTHKGGKEKKLSEKHKSRSRRHIAGIRAWLGHKDPNGKNSEKKRLAHRDGWWLETPWLKKKNAALGTHSIFP